MSKTALKFGLIAGGILLLGIMLPVFILGIDSVINLGEAFGYTVMVIAMIAVFLGIKAYRDKTLGGEITFGKAFGVGTYISAVAGFVFGLFSYAFYEFLFPDFTQKWMKYYEDKIRASGAPPEEIARQIAEFHSQADFWNNSFLQGLVMFFTVFVIGLVIALISSAILKRKKVQTV